MSGELKACSHCGHRDLYLKQISCEFVVVCRNYGAYGPNELTPERARETWNIRRLEDKLEAENAALKDRLLLIRRLFDAYSGAMKEELG